ncbi:hypothetical protein F5Y08DRAFT_310436 [Xylaria arbuscula]|nr:hypothetical protein F5Y08DRAFT_310436 [Xylaria arbuscula]
MRAPAEEFQCYPGIVGATVFDISPPGADGKSYLTYDNGQGTFYACPIGSGDDVYYNIYSALKPDAAGCVSVALALYDSSAECFTSSNNTAAIPSRRHQQTKPKASSVGQHKRRIAANSPAPSIISGYSQVPGAGLWSIMPSGASASTEATATSTPASAKSSQTCSISPSAPSIAPIRLGSPDKSAPGGIKDSVAEASITPHNSTVFLYSIPRSFLPPIEDNTKPPLCALQFRMPVCTELAKGYPCYRFSGLEQEVLANSGMTFDLILDDGHAAWNGTALQQVFPGENTVLGTFECGNPKGSYDKGSYEDRKMGWNVSSVREFGLEFLQAGVGDDAKFQDGIGAWIVPCQ